MSDVLPIPRVLAVLAGSAALILLGPVAAGAAEGWVLPLAPPTEVTRPFDPPDSPYGAGHRGVDLAGTPGRAVLAAGPGTVAFSAPLAGRGVVTVAHADGLRTTYEPVTGTVAVGTPVGAGTPIGTLEAGHTGCPVPACLHWGLRSGEEYLDPLGLLGGPVRLFPPARGAQSDVPAEQWSGGPGTDGRGDDAGADADGGPTGPRDGVTTGVGVAALLGATAVLASGRGRVRGPP